MSKYKVMRIAALPIGLAILALFLYGSGSSLAEAAGQRSTSPVFWTWEGPGAAKGTSQLVRNQDGISAQLTTSELPAGQAMTLWFIVFNYPADCVAGPYNCGPADLGTNRAAQGDFLLASGNVVGSSGQASFGGHLGVGDLSGSGMPELPGGCVPGYPDCGEPAGLINPAGALVILAVHSHGPAQSGQVLRSQISSYLGGCQVVIGTLPGGFSADASQVPDAAGECSTIQVSPHS